MKTGPVDLSAFLFRHVKIWTVKLLPGTFVILYANNFWWAIEHVFFIYSAKKMKIMNLLTSYILGFLELNPGKRCGSTTQVEHYFFLTTDLAAWWCASPVVPKVLVVVALPVLVSLVPGGRGGATARGCGALAPTTTTTTRVAATALSASCTSIWPFHYIF